MHSRLGIPRYTDGEHDTGEGRMIRTIILGTCVSVQGVFVRALQDGRIVIRTDSREFSGFPVSSTAA